MMTWRTLLIVYAGATVLSLFLRGVAVLDSCDCAERSSRSDMRVSESCSSSFAGCVIRECAGDGGPASSRSRWRSA